eukprot:gene6179-4457_t
MATETAIAAAVKPQIASLYVGELDPNIKENDLLNLFSPFGTILTVRVCRDMVSQRSLGYGFINYESHEAAQKAIETMNFKRVGDKCIRLMWQQRDPALRYSGAGNIFVKNLKTDLDSKNLHDIFTAFGTILSCKVMSDADGKSRGYGFVHFKSEEDAKTAIEKMNGAADYANEEKKALYVANFIRRNARLAALVANFTNVYIKQVLPTVEKETIEKFFAKFGGITSAAACKDKNGRVFGFCNFEKHEDAVKAIEEMHEKHVEGMSAPGETLYVQRAQPLSERLIALRQKYMQCQSLGNNLYVRNFDPEFTDGDLRKLFEEYGTIKSCKVMTDANGNSRGFGFVSFSTADEANAALREMYGRMLDGKPLVVNIAQRRDQRYTLLRMQFQKRLATFARQLRGAQMPPPGRFNRPPQGPPPGHPMGYDHPPMPMPMPQPMPSMPTPVLSSSTPKMAPPTPSLHPLSLEEFHSLSAEQRRDALGDRLFTQIQTIAPMEYVGKLTGMLLEYEAEFVYQLLRNPDMLQEKGLQYGEKKGRTLIPPASIRFFAQPLAARCSGYFAQRVFTKHQSNKQFSLKEKFEHRHRVPTNELCYPPRVGDANCSSNVGMSRQRAINIYCFLLSVVFFEIRWVMNGNPILAQHFGAGPYAQACSSPNGSDDDDYDASAGFSKFGSTSYRKIIYFKSKGQAPICEANPALPAARSPLAPLMPAEQPTDYDSRPEESRESDICASAESGHSNGTATPDDAGHHEGAPPPPSAAPNLSELMLHSRGVLEDAMRICEESRRTAEVPWQPPTTIADQSPETSLTSTAAVSPAQGSDGSKTVPSSSFDVPHTHPLSSAPEEKAPGPLVPSLRPSPRIDNSAANAAASRDPQQIVVTLVRDPASIVERRLSRRPAARRAVPSVGRSMSRTSDQIIEKMKQQPGSPVALPNKPQQPRDVAKSSESSLPRTDINPNMLSVETFGTILEKLTEFMRVQQPLEGSIPPLDATGSWLRKRSEALGTPTRQSQTLSPPTPRGVTLSGDRRPMRGPSQRRRFTATGQGRAVQKVPCYALPTQNWLSKHPKEVDASIGCYSSGSAGISGD